MIKTIKKVILSLLAVIVISCLIWIILFLNPNLSYANQTQFDIVTIFHNQELEESTEVIINDVIEILKRSELYDKNLNIQLCLNDDKIYPNLYPIFGTPLAYSMFNKTIVKNGEFNFNENIIEVQWKINTELQKHNLTKVLAHEFTHNLQSNANSSYKIRTTFPGKINWKLEGHADYIAKEFKNDGELKSKIEKYLIDSKKGELRLLIIDNKDGTKQIHSYFKYALVFQYLVEEKKMKFDEICKLETDLDELFSQMIEWSEK